MKRYWLEPNTKAREIIIHGPSVNLGKDITKPFHRLWGVKMFVGVREFDKHNDTKSVRIRSLLQETIPMSLGDGKGHKYHESRLFRAQVQFRGINEKTDGRYCHLFTPNVNLIQDEIGKLGHNDNTTNEVILTPFDENYSQANNFPGSKQLILPSMVLVEGKIEVSLDDENAENIGYFLHFHPKHGSSKEGGLLGRANFLGENKFFLTPHGIEMDIKVKGVDFASLESEDWNVRIIVSWDEKNYRAKLVSFLQDNGEVDSEKNKEVVSNLVTLLNVKQKDDIIDISYDSTDEIPDFTWPLYNSNRGKPQLHLQPEDPDKLHDRHFDLSNSDDSCLNCRPFFIDVGYGATRITIENELADLKSSAQVIKPIVSIKYNDGVEVTVGSNNSGITDAQNIDRLTWKRNKGENLVEVNKSEGSAPGSVAEESLGVAVSQSGLNTRLKDLYQNVNGFNGDEKTLYAFAPLKKGWLQLPVKNTKFFQPIHSEQIKDDQIVGSISLALPVGIRQVSDEIGEPVEVELPKPFINIGNVESLSAKIVFKSDGISVSRVYSELKLQGIRGQVERLLYLANTPPSSEEVLPTLTAGHQALRSFPLTFGNQKMEHDLEFNILKRKSSTLADGKNKEVDEIELSNIKLKGLKAILWEPFASLPLVASVPMTRTSEGGDQPSYSRDLIPRTVEVKSLSLQSNGFFVPEIDKKQALDPLCWEWPDPKKTVFEAERRPEVTMIPITVPGIQLAPPLLKVTDKDDLVCQNNINLDDDSPRCSLSFEQPLLFEMFANASIPDDGKEEKDFQGLGSVNIQSDDGFKNEEPLKRDAPTALHIDKLKRYWRKAVDKQSLTRVRQSYALDYKRAEKGINEEELRNLYGDYVWETEFSVGYKVDEEGTIGHYILGNEKYYGTHALKGVDAVFKIDEGKLKKSDTCEDCIEVVGNASVLRTKNYDGKEVYFDTRDVGVSNIKNVLGGSVRSAVVQGKHYSQVTKSFKSVKLAGESCINFYVRDLPSEAKGDGYVFDRQNEGVENDELISDKHYTTSAYEWRLFSNEMDYGIEVGDVVLFPKRIDHLELSKNTLSIINCEITCILDLKDEKKTTQGKISEEPLELVEENEVVIIFKEDAFSLKDDGKTFYKYALVDLDDGSSELKKNYPINYQFKINSGFKVIDDGIDTILFGVPFKGDRVISPINDDKQDVSLRVNGFALDRKNLIWNLKVFYSVRLMHTHDKKSPLVMLNVGKDDFSINWLGVVFKLEKSKKEFLLKTNHSAGELFLNWDLSEKSTGKSQGVFIKKLIDSKHSPVDFKGAIQLFRSSDEGLVGIFDGEVVTTGKWRFFHDIKSESVDSKIDWRSKLLVSSPQIDRISEISWPDEDINWRHFIKFKLNEYLLPAGDLLDSNYNLVNPWTLIVNIKNGVGKIDEEDPKLLEWSSVNYISIVDADADADADYSFTSRYKHNDEENNLLVAGVAKRMFARAGFPVEGMNLDGVKGLMIIGGSAQLYNDGPNRKSRFLTMPWLAGFTGSTLPTFSQELYDEVNLNEYDEYLGEPQLLQNLQGKQSYVNSNEEKELFAQVLGKEVDDSKLYEMRERLSNFQFVEQPFLQINDGVDLPENANNIAYFAHSLINLTMIMNDIPKDKTSYSPGQWRSLIVTGEAKVISANCRYYTEDLRKEKVIDAKVFVVAEKYENLEGLEPVKTLGIFEKSFTDLTESGDENSMKLLKEKFEQEYLKVKGILLKFSKDKKLVLVEETEEKDKVAIDSRWERQSLYSDVIRLEPLKPTVLFKPSHGLGWPVSPNEKLDQMHQEINKDLVLQGERVTGRKIGRRYPALASEDPNSLSISFGRKVLFERGDDESLPQDDSRAARHLMTMPPRIRLSSDESIKRPLKKYEGDSAWLSILPSLLHRTTLGERPGALYGVTDSIVMPSKIGGESVDLDTDYARFGVVGESGNVISQQLRAPRSKAYPMDFGEFPIRRSTYFGSVITGDNVKELSSEKLFSVAEGRATYFRISNIRTLMKLLNINETDKQVKNHLESELGSKGPVAAVIHLDRGTTINSGWKGNINGELELKEKISIDCSDDAENCFVNCESCYLEIGDSVVNLKTNAGGKTGKLKFNNSFSTELKSLKDDQKIAYELSRLRMDTKCRLHLILNLDDKGDIRHVYIEVPVEASEGYFLPTQTRTLMFGDPSYDRGLITPASQVLIDEVMAATDRKQYDASSSIYFAIAKYHRKKDVFEEGEIKVRLRIELVRDPESLDEDSVEKLVDLYVSNPWSETELVKTEPKIKKYYEMKTQLSPLVMDLKQLYSWDKKEDRLSESPVKMRGKDKLKLIFSKDSEQKTIILEIVDKAVIAPPAAVYTLINLEDDEDKQVSGVRMHATSPMPTNIEFPDLLSDLATGLVRRSGLFVWNFAEPDKTDQSYYLCKMDRSGGAQLPDKDNEFIKRMKYRIDIKKDKDSSTQGRLTFTDGPIGINAECWFDENTPIETGKTYTGAATRMATKFDSVETNKKRPGIFLKEFGSRGIFIHEGKDVSWSEGCVVLNRDDMMKMWDHIIAQGDMDKFEIEVVIS